MKKEIPTTQEALKQLRLLVEEAGKNYYIRIFLAATLLANDDWIKSEHDGDSFAAAKVLEDLYFHDLCGAMDLFCLLSIYQRYPNESDWVKYKYNLRKMYDTIRKTQPKATRRKVKVADYEKVCTTVKELEYRLKRQEEEIEQAETLTKKVERLERENIKLKGRIQELERVLETFKLKIPA